MADDRAQVTLVIEGRAQGVFFRASTLEQAQSLNVTGWVKNCGDGSVEVVAEGARSALDQLIAWCHHGPPAARIDHVGIRWSAFKDEFDTFRIVR